MKYWVCRQCEHEELVPPQAFIKNCPACFIPMTVLKVNDDIVTKELERKMNEVKTRNPNTGTLVEVVQRDDGFSIVEKIDHQEGGKYETTVPKSARCKSTRIDPSELDEGLQRT